MLKSWCLFTSSYPFCSYEPSETESESTGPLSHTLQDHLLINSPPGETFIIIYFEFVVKLYKSLNNWQFGAIHFYNTALNQYKSLYNVSCGLFSVLIFLFFFLVTCRVYQHGPPEEILRGSKWILSMLFQLFSSLQQSGCRGWEKSMLMQNNEQLKYSQMQTVDNAQAMSCLNSVYAPGIF